MTPDDYPWGDQWEEGDEAIVTTRSGHTFKARFTLAPGIDYFWNPVVESVQTNYLADPIMTAKRIKT